MSLPPEMRANGKVVIPPPISINFSPSDDNPTLKNSDPVPKKTLSEIIHNSIASSKEEWAEKHKPLVYEGQPIEITGDAFTTQELLESGFFLDNSKKPLFPEFSLAYGKRQMIKVKPYISTDEEFFTSSSQESPMVLTCGEKVFKVGKRYIVNGEVVFLFAFTKDKEGKPKAIVNSQFHISLFPVDLDQLRPKDLPSPDALYLPPENCYSSGKRLDVGTLVEFNGSTHELRAFVVTLKNGASQISAILENCEGKKTEVNIEKFI
jgi:hypothetical protein